MDLIAPLTQEKRDKILAELCQAICELYGCRLVRLVLYGSQARGDAMPGSDIDILIVLDGDVNPSEEIRRTSSILVGLSLKSDELISRVFISAKHFYDDTPLLINVRQEGTVLYETSTASFAV
jgi:predicted nucleotidyltransferase